jgi:hypothetical protein
MGNYCPHTITRRFLKSTCTTLPLAAVITLGCGLRTCLAGFVSSGWMVKLPSRMSVIWLRPVLAHARGGYRLSGTGVVSLA